MYPPWYESFGTILGAVLAAGTLIGLARTWWIRTLGRRRWVTRALRRLGTNAQVEYFTRQLGAPPAMREEHVVETMTRAFLHLSSLNTSAPATTMVARSRHRLD